MKIAKSNKKKAKEMRDSILERMSEEQLWQADLRHSMLRAEDEEYVKQKLLFDESVKHWEVLNKSLSEYEKLSKTKINITPDTMLVVAGNLAGILLILNFEKLDIVRTKAISFVLKGRL